MTGAERDGGEILARVLLASRESQPLKNKWIRLDSQLK